jgi:uncharacterized membrane protein
MASSDAHGLHLARIEQPGVLGMAGSLARNWRPLLAAGLVAVLASFVLPRVLQTHLPGPSDDIYWVWWHGDSIAKGENPYARIVGQDMFKNRKYPTYFPTVPLIIALQQKLAPSTFKEWAAIYRQVLVWFHIAVGVLLFMIAYRRAGTIAALFASSFWLFNRWSLVILRIAHLDTPAVFFLLLALCLLGSRPRAAHVSLGLSLAIKQMAICLLPLFVIRSVQEGHKGSVREAAGTAATILLLPALMSVPFLVWNFEGFVRSMFFSATRQAGSHIPLADSVDVLMGWAGFEARLLMLGLMAAVYWCYSKRTIEFSASALLIMACFLHFNPVLFQQYFVWLVPLLVIVCIRNR